MTTAYEIPLSPNPQKFTIQLAATTYVMRVQWNRFEAAWSLSIADANEVPILEGIPLVTGIDLLGQFDYLEFGGSLIVQTDYEPDAVPTFANLGTEGRLYFVVEP